MTKNDSILIKGARVNNLKNIDVEIPRNRLVVITGLSGSGKSSLAFDTLYAEGQRRYVESLSSYARQFLGRMSKPECDFIKGIPPAITIEQKVNSRNPRSTVGTSTEIYEYMRLLFARIGRTFSPVSGQEVKKHSVEDIVNCMLEQPEGTRYTVLTPVLPREGRSLAEQLEMDMKQGFSRLEVNGETVRIDEYTPRKGDTVFLLVDRMNKRFVRVERSELRHLLPKKAGFAHLEKLIYAAAKPGGKTVLRGSDLGIPSLEKGQLELSDFSDKVLSISPTSLSGRYKEVKVEELLEMLMSL